jgi:hypothetical protein
VRPFPVEVEDGKVIAAVLAEEGDGREEQRLTGPYVAEVIPVSVEGQYLVVTMSRVPVGQSASATGDQIGGGRP